MPFSKYLTNDVSTTTPNNPPNGNKPPFSHAVQFQIPSFIHSNIPTLAPGGGAEVLTFNPAWFTNNGFTSTTTTSPAFHSPDFDSSISIAHPFPSFGLPVYSASGFDLLSILARVVTRPNPTIALGPVDLTCSFVIVDVRRYDHPIVYCSPSFCHLTGYPEAEILGRNCRFLQAPGGTVSRGSPRRFTSQQNVALMRKALSADKEVQTCIVNYRKDGTPFVNLVSVVPIFGGVRGAAEETNNVVWHVGFQVDLTEQPGAILDRVRDGTYIIDEQVNGLWNQHLPSQGVSSQQCLKLDSLEKKKLYNILPPIRMSETLKILFCHDSSSTVTTNTDPSQTTSHPLSLLLLSHAPDFIHVVSLKGAFLYVAPSITHTLGYTPTELIGRCMADIAHPEDVVPLERQLKESSTVHASGDFDPHSILSSASSSGGPTFTSTQPRPVDIVFRARTRGGRYVWVECRGRLHVEPGKGRKAIVLSGRAREMGRVLWGDVKSMSPSLLTSVETMDSTGDSRNYIGSVDGNTAEDGIRLVEENSGANWRASLSVAPSSSADGTNNETQLYPRARPYSTSQTQSLEFWALLSGLGPGVGALVSVSRSIIDILGWPKNAIVGYRIGELVIGEWARRAVEGTLSEWERQNRDVTHAASGDEGVPCGTTGPSSTLGRAQTLRCSMATRPGGVVRVVLVFYRPSWVSGSTALEETKLDVAPSHVILQARLDTDSTANLSDGSLTMTSLPSSWLSPGGLHPYPLNLSSHRGGTPMPTPLPSLALPQDPLLTRLPTSNIFTELETGRGSSWQYELQQLKFANRRLVEEIRSREDIVREVVGSKGVTSLTSHDLSDQNDVASGDSVNEGGQTTPISSNVTVSYDSSATGGNTSASNPLQSAHAPNAHVEFADYDMNANSHLSRLDLSESRVGMEMYIQLSPETSYPHIGVYRARGQGNSRGGTEPNLRTDNANAGGIFVKEKGIEQAFVPPSVSDSSLSMSNGADSGHRERFQDYQQYEQRQGYSRQHYPYPQHQLHAPIPLAASTQREQSSLIQGYGIRPRLPMHRRLEHSQLQQSQLQQQPHQWHPFLQHGVKRPFQP